MSQNSCCVPGCLSSRKDGVPLHRFPNPIKFPDKYQSWITNIGGSLASLDDQTIYDNRRVCRKHFEDVHKYPKNKLCFLATPVLHMPAESIMAVNETQDSAQPTTSDEQTFFYLLIHGSTLWQVNLFPTLYATKGTHMAMINLLWKETKELYIHAVSGMLEKKKTDAADFLMFFEELFDSVLSMVVSVN